MEEAEDTRTLLTALLWSQQNMQNNVNQMANLMAQFMNQNLNQNNIRENGGREEKTENNQPEGSTTSRPSMPTFTPRNPYPERERMIRELQDEIYQDWLQAGEGFITSMTFREYLDVRMKHRSKEQWGIIMNCRGRLVKCQSLILTDQERLLLEPG